MKHFLRQIAEAYYTKYADGLPQTRFVFPNRRAIAFFKHEMQRFMGDDVKTLQMKTLRELAEDLAKMKEGKPLDRLLTLYNCYSSLNHDGVEFDKFRFWGEMLLSDFDDVDTSLADARMLFRNVETYKEVQSNYLTEEQLEIIRQYWPNNELQPRKMDQFWQHIDPEDKETRVKFLELWRVLGELYVSYNDTLKKKNKGGPGHILRTAVEALKTDRPQGFARCVFIGFSNMSPALLKIMELLRNYELADFYWDLPTKPFRQLSPQISRHIEILVKKFPSIYPLDDTDPATKPEIVISGVSSKSAQAAIASAQVRAWIDDKKTITTPENAVHTAIVLPDETLFQHVAESMPEDILSMNITMGIALRTTPIAALVSNIVAMQARARKIKGEWVFFCQDISKVISSPLLLKLLPQSCHALTELMREKQSFMLPGSELLACRKPDADAPEQTEDPEERLFSAIFSEVKYGELQSAYSYLKNILEALKAIFDGKKPDKDDKNKLVEEWFVEAYLHHLDEIYNAINRHGVTLKDESFLRMIERAVGAEEFRLQGEPLSGLQIMGVLETRVLDFDNVIFLSMNEGLFPNGKSHSHSFIPENLRRAYGLPSSDKEQKMQSFYFFRLLSKCKKARLMYVNTTTGLGSAEMSRFLTQLLFAKGDICTVKHTVAAPPAFSNIGVPIIVEKTPDLMAALEKFKYHGTEKAQANLSPSAINTLIDCPLRFYLQYVLGLDVDDTTDDFIDQSTYGTIVHYILELVYQNLRTKAPANPDGSFTVTPGMFNDFLNPPAVALDQIITQSFNEVCNEHKKNKPDIHAKLKGEQYLLSLVVKRIVQAVLRYDQEIAPFDYVDSEMRLNLPLEIAPDITVNINGFIDRVDRRDGKLRIVDYKTGSDKTSFKVLDDVFNPLTDGRRKAILQTLLYCCLYNDKTGSTQPIQPFIYTISTVLQEKFTAIKFDKNDLESHLVLQPAFMDELKLAVAKLFDPQEPFTQAVNPHACKYCNFRAMCSR